MNHRKPTAKQERDYKQTLQHLYERHVKTGNPSADFVMGYTHGLFDAGVIDYSTAVDITDPLERK